MIMQGTERTCGGVDQGSRKKVNTHTKTVMSETRGVPVRGDNHIHINPLLPRLERIQMVLPGILQKLFKRERHIRKQGIEVHPQHPVWIADIESTVDKGYFTPYAGVVIVWEGLEVRME